MTISEELYINLCVLMRLIFMMPFRKISVYQHNVRNRFCLWLITSPLDLNNENSHVLIFDTSIHLLNRWLTDEVLTMYRYCVFNPIVANFAKVSKRS